MPRAGFNFALLTALLVPLATSAEPVFVNAEIHPMGSPAPDLERAFSTLLEQDAGPAWAAYTVPMVAGRQMLCCGGPSLCSLERSGDCFVNRGD